MKLLLSTLALAVLTSNVAAAKNNFEFKADAQAQAKILAAQASIAYQNKLNKLRISGNTVTDFSSRQDGGNIDYTLKSKTGNTQFNVGVGMRDFSRSQSFGGSAGIQIKF